jgi:hypothetical protein
MTSSGSIFVITSCSKNFLRPAVVGAVHSCAGAS